MANTITLPVEPALDQRCWNDSTSGLISMKLAYEFKRKQYSTKQWAKSIWCRDIPPSKSLNWSPQCKVTIKAAIINLLNAIWLARNNARFNNKTTHWKSSVAWILSNTALTGNNSSGVCSASIREFVILKSLNVSLHPPKPLIMKEIIWQPPIPQWVKCNTDGASNTSTSSCGGLFRNHNAYFLCAFAENTGLKSAYKAKLCGVMRAIEITAGRNWSNLLLETDSTLVVMGFKSSALVPWDLGKETNVRISWLI
ncbi:glycerol-3-phosphate dehydrogenase [Trifolium medium]|uniref:Glycerol-3-phosphate dehydrogenase n=1 Tax=Trifolium medium TaxID=97028 RepID=A0A392MPN5_9FABA|nr:glycerol-3-phosphate dehydrogenase [Trifolium medium]